MVGGIMPTGYSAARLSCAAAFADCSFMLLRRMPHRPDLACLAVNGLLKPPFLALTWSSAWANLPKTSSTPKATPSRARALPELRAYMDANFERAAGRRRLVDRPLMNGEWPILLKVMGKTGTAGRYLSLKEVEELFVKQRLLKRMGK